MLKIQRTSNEDVVLSLSGRMDEEHIAELEAIISSEAKGRRIVLDLMNLTLAGHEVISFLERSEADGIALLNCAPYVREWITRMRVES
jgi:anti-anti-sigma regulatory factor